MCTRFERPSRLQTDDATVAGLWGPEHGVRLRYYLGFRVGGYRNRGVHGVRSPCPNGGRRPFHGSCAGLHRATPRSYGRSGDDAQSARGSVLAARLPWIRRQSSHAVGRFSRVHGRDGLRRSDLRRGDDAWHADRRAGRRRPLRQRRRSPSHRLDAHAQMARRQRSGPGRARAHERGFRRGVRDWNLPSKHHALDVSSRARRDGVSGEHDRRRLLGAPERRRARRR